MFKPTEVETFAGVAVDVVDPKPHTIDLDDIAQSLSRLCRFNGHTSTFYPVSLHCIMVAELMIEMVGHYREAYLWGLLHDAPEAYISDIPRPVKQQFAGVKEMEERLMEVICEKFLLVYPCPWGEDLKLCDNVALKLEARKYMTSKGKGYNCFEGVKETLELPECFLSKVKLRRFNNDFYSEADWYLQKFDNAQRYPRYPEA